MRLQTKVLPFRHGYRAVSSKAVHSEIGLVAVDVHDVIQSRDVPVAANANLANRILDSVDSPCGIRTPATQGSGGELVCARESPKISKYKVPGPVAVASPLIIGRVVRRKAKPKNTFSSFENRHGEEVADFYGQLWVIPSPRRRPRPHKTQPPPPPKP